MVCFVLNGRAIRDITKRIKTTGTANLVPLLPCRTGRARHAHRTDGRALLRRVPQGMRGMGAYARG